MTEPIWDIHNDTLTHKLVGQGFVSIGWDGLGDLTQIRRLSPLAWCQNPRQAHRRLAR